MLFYVASGLQNSAKAKEIINMLESMGHECAYNWTKHNDVRSEGPERMTDVAYFESTAVKYAELVVVLLPGGAGTHTELRMAIASKTNKRIIIWSETGAHFASDSNTCVFYFHSTVERITGSIEVLRDFLKNV